MDNLLLNDFVVYHYLDSVEAITVILNLQFIVLIYPEEEVGTIMTLFTVEATFKWCPIIWAHLSEKAPVWCSYFAMNVFDTWLIAWFEFVFKLKKELYQYIPWEIFGCTWVMTSVCGMYFFVFYCSGAFFMKWRVYYLPNIVYIVFELRESFSKF